MQKTISVEEPEVTKNLDDLLGSVTKLPSLPAIAIRIIQEVKKDKTSLNDLAGIIAYDPALTAKILQVANSSFYSLPYKVESIEKAVHILGIEALKNIALSFIIVKGLKRTKIDKFDHELFWRRSITAAVALGMIASRLNMKREDTFVTPLLMNIGVLVMYLCRPNDYLSVIDEKRVSHVRTDEAEKKVFGFDHQDVGSAILKKWGIPEAIIMPIAYHHRAQDCPPELEHMVGILRLADMASSVYHGQKSTEKFSALKASLQETLRLSDDECSEFIDAVAEKTVEIFSSFEMDPADMKPYSQILQEANEELGKLNLSYEQLLLEVQQEKKKAENLARELKTANEMLRGLAFKDALTGLYNYRYFQEHLEKEVERADRYGRTLSLIMVDIDHFKKVNDTYGHPVGDIVIRSIADLFEKTVRTSDTSARYGGEEFILILPETDIKGAVVLADRLRKMAEGLNVRADNQDIGVTISLGVTAYEPGKGKKTKAQIIESADRALYNSKQTGRNKLSIIL